MAFRLDGEVPVIKDTFTLNPYALLGLNLGYNTTDSYGWNNFEFGVQGNWQINQYLTAFAGANYSVAMTALFMLVCLIAVWWIFKTGYRLRR